MAVSSEVVQLPDLIGPVLEAKWRKIKVYPQHKNRASECGHECERYLVLCRTRWQDRALHDVGLEFIFEGGRLIEDMAVRELQDAGLRVIEQQRPFEWPMYELTGHLDFKVLPDGWKVPVPVEVKGLNHWDAERLNCLEDFLSSPKPWIRKYPAQLTAYMLNTGESEWGAFYIKDKLTYRPKIIWIKLDYEYAESILQKLARINQHVRDGTLPPPVNDIMWCENCPFAHVCLPEVKAGADLELLDDEDLLAKLERRATLAEAASEYERLDQEIKKALNGHEKACIGDYLITGKPVTRKGYVVPESSFWQTKIVRLGGVPSA